MDTPAGLVKLVDITLWSPCDIHVLEGYAGVFPFGYNSRLENDGDARFRSKIVANRAGDIDYNPISVR